MPPEDDTIEAAPPKPGRLRFRRDSPEPEPEATSASAPAKAKKTRKQMPESTKRLLFIVAGVLVLVGSVGGFYLTSDAFETRVPVLVAAREITAGETLGSADFRSELMITGSVPHIPWTADAPAVFEGTVALQQIPMGGLVRHDMVALADTVPEGDELVAEVPLDLSLVTESVLEGISYYWSTPGSRRHRTIRDDPAMSCASSR